MSHKHFSGPNQDQNAVSGAHFQKLSKNLEDPEKVNTFLALLLVFLGGSLGASLRYGADLLLAQTTFMCTIFPLSTWLVNLLGAFILGFLCAWWTKAVKLRLFFATGVLGAFTTYASLALAAGQFLDVGSGMVGIEAGGPHLDIAHLFLALASMALVMVLGLAAATAGFTLGYRRQQILGSRI